jgi:hypothetical protein
MQMRNLNVRAEEHGNWCPHMLALRSIQSAWTPRSVSWALVVSALARIRGAPFSNLPRPKKTARGTIVRWIESTPVLRGWALSEKCLRSPPKWPQAVLPAFKYRLIPSPYQLSNVNMGQKYAETSRTLTRHTQLLLYCMGFSVEQIAEALDASPEMVYEYMYEGIMNLFKLPQFLLWSTATDFRLAVPPPGLREYGLLKRAQLMETLQSNPFLLDSKDAQQLLEPTSHLTYLVYSSPKQPRLVPTCRLYRTMEEWDVPQKSL